MCDMRLKMDNDLAQPILVSTSLTHLLESQSHWPNEPLELGRLACKTLADEGHLRNHPLKATDLKPKTGK